jgi:hypothetical protein
MTAFDGADGDGVSDEPGLETGFDREQAANALQHRHKVKQVSRQWRSFAIFELANMVKCQLTLHELGQIEGLE